MMVQTIPREPSLAELIGSGMSQGLQTGMQGKMQLFQALQMEKQKQQLKQERMQKILSGLGLSQPTGQEQQGMPQEMQSQGQMPSSQNDQMSQLEKIATNPQAMLALTAEQPQMAAQIQSMYGNLLKKREASAKETISPEKKGRLTQTISEQLKKLKEGNIGFFETGTNLSSKAREDRSFFDNLSIEIEGLFAGMVGKGPLNKERFKYLKARLPNSSDTKAKTIGKLKAIAKEFKLDIPGLFDEKQGPIQQETSGTQAFNVGGKNYNIPADQVEDFKKEMGLQ